MQNKKNHKKLREQNIEKRYEKDYIYVSYNLVYSSIKLNLPLSRLMKKKKVQMMKTMDLVEPRKK